MNQAQKEAVWQIISNHQDDLYRYQRAERHSPGQKTGNGQTFTDVIADIERRISELKEGM